MTLFTRCAPHLARAARPAARRFASTAPPKSSGFSGSFVKAAAVFVAGATSALAYHSFTNSAVPEPKPTLPLSELQPPKYATGATLEKALAEIEAVVGSSNVSRDKSDLDSHSDTYWSIEHPEPHQRPKMVVSATTTEQVSAIMKICYKYAVPVVPFSGGTSLEGQFIPTRGGICLDVSGMDRIVELHEDDLDVVVEAGVGWQDLDQFLRPHGLFFGPDPGPGAQIGGMCATSCSGTNAARWGTMRDNVLSLEVVLADGTVITTRRRPKKSSAGYNLTGLLIGSEGTLGIITKATLKLHPRPAAERVALITFDSISDATQSVSDIVKRGIQLGAIELIDDVMIQYINSVGISKRNWIEKHSLLLKFQGSESEIHSTVKSVQEIVKSHKAYSFDFAANDKESEELWSARKIGLWTTIEYGKRKNPAAQAWSTDVAVPISQLATLIDQSREAFDASSLDIAIMGHVGDGNFHSCMIYNNAEEKEKAEELASQLVARALALGGTCTGEHGVGLGKRDYLIDEVGADAVDTMRRLKFALDPKLLLNMDKIFYMDQKEAEEHLHANHPTQISCC